MLVSVVTGSEGSSGRMMPVKIKNCPAVDLLHLDTPRQLVKLLTASEE